MCQIFFIPFTECCLVLFFFFFFFSYINELQGANSSHMPIAMKVLEESRGPVPLPSSSAPDSYAGRMLLGLFK